MQTCSFNWKAMARRARMNRRSGAMFSVLAMLAPLTPSQAQTAPTALIFPERVSSVTVTPAVADVGVAREIRVAGNWNGCPPVDATVANNDDVSPPGDPATRALRFIIPLTFSPCPPFFPYTVTTSFTPTTRGVIRLLVLNFDGEYLTETRIDTRAPTDNRSAFNITGMWYDPQSNGSGLTFVHSKIGDNTVFGTWYVYDGTGKPRWYTIQNTEWKPQGRVLEGQLFATTAVANCPAPFNACPVPLTGFTLVGRARFTVTGDNAARVDALTTDGAVIFSSNVIRAEI